MMHLVIEISHDLYFNLEKIENGNTECQTILDAVKNGETYFRYENNHRRKGRWIDRGYIAVQFCSECGEGSMFKTPCCPYCGARLEDKDGE